MATILDSINVFLERSQAIGLSVTSVEALTEAGVDTLNKLAFCSSFRLGNTDDSTLVAALNSARLAKLGANLDANAGDLACFRRLHFEASTMSLAELKMRVERTDETAPKRLPLAERTSRYNDQVTRLTGLDLSGDLEPSHALVDLTFQQLEEGVLQFIPLEKCTRRSQELHGVRRESVVKVTSGNLAVGTSEIQVTADLSSEMRVRSAMQRRALAYDQSGLIDYQTLMKWTDFLSVGFSQVSMEQILQADRRLWLTAAEYTRDGISTGPRPTRLEVALGLARADPQVSMLLMPLPKSSSSRSNSGDQYVKPHKVPTKTDYPKNDKKGKGNKGGGKKSSKSAVRMPEQLRGLHYKTKDGDSICFNYNLGTCTSTSGSCERGKHVCMQPFCYGSHRQSECDKKKRK